MSWPQLWARWRGTREPDLPEQLKKAMELIRRDPSWTTIRTKRARAFAERSDLLARIIDRHATALRALRETLGEPENEINVCWFLRAAEGELGQALVELARQTTWGGPVPEGETRAPLQN